MAKWHSKTAAEFARPGQIANLKAKQAVADRIAQQARNGDVIGFGSGSTSFVAILAIGARIKAEQLSCVAIPTSAEVELACASLDIPTTTLLAARPDWAFDGADEVDPKGDVLKGRGGAMFREKLVFRSSPRRYILVDLSKLVPALGQKFPIPVEVFPAATHLVESALLSLGASEVQLRKAVGKDGPVITESGNFILDARFARVEPTLEKEIKSITGVIESGLFQGFSPEVLVAQD
ncbi:MAG: ribose 5-phosphate isomerase A [Candidatus Acidiferrales bacterium]